MGKRGFLTVCHKCFSSEKVETLTKTVTENVLVTEKFKQENVVNCRHSAIAEPLFLDDIVNSAKQIQTNCEVVTDDNKRHLSISFNGETHGLIFVNKARKGNKGNCVTCKSINCSHVQVWNRELKKKVLQVDSSSENDIDETELDQISDESVPDEDELETIEFVGQKLKYPFDSVTQENMRFYDTCTYENLTELVSDHCDGLCQHQNSWSKDDPVERGWIFSRNVKIFHSTYVKKKQRAVFYRKTTGGCDCIKTHPMFHTRGILI